MADDKPTTSSGFKAGIEVGPDGEDTGDIVCYPSDKPNCTVVREPKPAAVDSTGFLSLPDPLPFHDDALVKATAEINEILLRVLAKRDHRKGNLHVVLSSDGPMLCWVRSMVMPTDDITQLNRTKHH